MFDPNTDREVDQRERERADGQPPRDGSEPGPVARHLRQAHRHRGIRVRQGGAGEADGYHGLETDLLPQVTSPRVDCGRNYNAVLARYSPLFNLGQIYGNLNHQQYSSTSYNGAQHAGLNIPAQLQPDVLSFSAQKLGSELKTELSCLTNEKLTRCIDTLVDTIVKRLDATKDLIEVNQQLEIVKSNLN